MRELPDTPIVNPHTEPIVADAKPRPKCFIVMPISTPSAYLEERDDPEHFKHVMDCLICPAVEKAGYESIKPIADGSEVIHDRIIKHLESAEMVLCDMSSLNANAFFELGVRTALNLPTALIRDELTKKIPFDLSIVNYHTYSSKLNSWEIVEQVETLAKHVKTCAETSNGSNTMWKRFGIELSATAHDGNASEDSKTDYIVEQMMSMQRELSSQHRLLKVMQNRDLRARRENQEDDAERVRVVSDEDEIVTWLSKRDLAELLAEHMGEYEPIAAKLGQERSRIKSLVHMFNLEGMVRMLRNQRRKEGM